MAKQTYKKHLNKNNKSNNYKGNNSKKENVKIEAINYTEGITVGELANKINRAKLLSYCLCLVRC